MTENIRSMKQAFVIDKVQKAFWQEPLRPDCLAVTYAANGMPDHDRATDRLIYVLNQEKPVVFENERIAFTRTVPVIPELFTDAEMESLKQSHWIHEKGDVCNINVDYTMLLGTGLTDKKEELAQALTSQKENGHPLTAHYLENQIRILDALQDLANRYQEEAERTGNRIVADTLKKVPANAPESFLEALQMFRILHFTMWCGRNYHNTIGRFDQYLYPYLQKDLADGRLTEEEAFELLEEFFLTFNRDSDLYPGMQQGDNGQSMVLGGRNADGTDSYNLLSEMCLKASLELKVIDPKINLRVSKDTPIETFVLGTQLTRQGLGFPQYSNDDVVIPGLIDWGYSEADAYNYVVAACWEFIIPGVAMDIPNIEAVCFAQAVEDAVFQDLEDCHDYEEFRNAVKRHIQAQVAELTEKVKNLYVFPAPFLSLMTTPKNPELPDISLGGIYNNFGFHGTGLATAVDSLTVVRKYVFEEKKLTPQRLIQILQNNFEGEDLLRNELRYSSMKFGNHIPEVDELADQLLGDFADSLKGITNERGGIYRAGTGSAMYYIWHAKDLPATPDGREAGEGLPANYSPSLFSKCKGPVSIVQSFSSPDLRRVINGGPLTLELHDTMFRTEGSIEKVAMLVKSFVDLGGHQLQLNAVNKETLLDAQKHPENYRNLIVRVWGWSGYFVELDKVYQDHIIQRMELAV